MLLSLIVSGSAAEARPRDGHFRQIFSPQMFLNNEHGPAPPQHITITFVLEKQTGNKLNVATAPGLARRAESVIDACQAV